MHPYLLRITCLLFASLMTAKAGDVPAPLIGFLDSHCLECHDADQTKGGLNLDALPFDLEKPENFATWQRVFERVESGEMPPAKKPRPAKGEQETFLTGLHEPLYQTDLADISENGRVRSRRLTRVEYENSLHDLLGIDLPLAGLLPEDPESYGFETVASGQQLSYHQLSRYLDVADLALEAAFQRIENGDVRFSKSLTPQQLIKNNGGNYRGPDLRDGKSISWPITLQFFGRMRPTAVPESGWYRITLKQVEAVNPGPGGSVWGTLRSGTCDSNAPLLFMIGLVEASAKSRDLVYEAWIEGGHQLELKPNDATLKRPATGAKGGNVSFKGRDLEKDGYSGIAHRGIEMERIYPNANRKTVEKNLYGEKTPEVWEADRRAAVDQLVARFARRAFRRPQSPEQVAPYQKLAAATLDEGGSLAAALKTGYRAILCSPRFLTFVEAPGSLDDFAIASRLSYALWASLPDWKLIQAASEGKLKDPASLTAEVNRLLANPKSKRFLESFSDQWLKLKLIDFTAPDPRQFKTFDPVLQESFLAETRTYLADLIQNDRGIAHLVDSDFAYLNERLKRHYQLNIPITAGEGLQKASLPAEGKIRGGLLTQGAILKVTADGTHTSPVVRGVFVNERILGVHIPPPPPGIPAIEPDIRGAVSIRDQLEKHRNSESCASCHRTIDPPGFALENFDPIGGWRTKYGTSGKGAKVDPTGLTPDGATFENIASWKQLYRDREDQLAAAFVRQFLTYATGARPRFSDEERINEIVNTTTKQGYGMQSLMRAALTSPIFLSK
jgi:hypothetical protein